MNRKEYYKNLKNIIDNGYNDYQTKLKDYNQLKKEREEGRFSIGYLNNNILPRLQDMKRELDSIQKKVKDDISTLTEQMKQQTANIDVLNPSELTDDIKLLQGGLILKERDILGILERNSNNRTMTQLAMRYAQEHGMKSIGAPNYASAQDISRSYDSIKDSVGFVVKWFDDDNAYKKMYDTVLGEESGCVTGFCNTDSDI